MSSIRLINHSNNKISGYHEDQNDYNYIANAFSFYLNVPIERNSSIQFDIMWNFEPKVYHTLLASC